MNKWIVIFLFSALSGCSTFPKAVWFQSVDELLAEHQYNRAMDQIQATKPLDQALLNRVQEKAQQYRKKQVKYIQTLLIKKQWGIASQELSQLEQQVPTSSKLAALRVQLQHLESEEALNIKIERYLLEAQLIKHKQVELAYKKRLLTASWYETSALERQALNVSEVLSTLAQQALDSKEYDLAKRTITAAKDLNSDTHSDALERKINQKITQSQKATQTQIKAKYVKELESAIEDENFEYILKTIHKLSKTNYKGKDIRQAVNKANQLLKNTAKELDQQADLAYRNGHISDAILFWQQSQSLYPELANVKEKLSRAQKVSSKLKQLRESQIQ